MGIETKGVSKTVQAQRSLNRHDDHMSCGALDGILEHKKAEGNLNKIWIAVQNNVSVCAHQL